MRNRKYIRQEKRPDIEIANPRFAYPFGMKSLHPELPKQCAPLRLRRFSLWEQDLFPEAVRGDLAEEEDAS